jgi:crotonobetainyl-CoA:carnitine CoA-transferase CaiB-like acyl-CoA transferase
VSADVVLTNMVPATATKLRIDPDTLRAMNNALITCRITGFRSDSPRVDEPSFDLTHQALAGYLTISGTEEAGPIRVGIPIADLAVALFSAYGVLAALVNRERTGNGENIEVPMYDSLLSLLTYQATLYLNAGEVPARVGSAHPHTVPWQAFQAIDGGFVVAVRNQKFWQRLCTSLNRDDLAVDPRFATNEARLSYRLELERELQTVFSAGTRAHWIDQLRAGGVPVAPVNTVADALDAELSSGSALIGEFEDADLGAVKFINNPVRFSRMTLAPPEPAPALDENHTQFLT